MFTTTKQRAAALLALTGTMVGAPLAMAPAMALDLPIPEGTLPPEVEAVVDEAEAALPPEVAEAVDPIVADVFAQLVGLDIQYVQQASSEPGHSSASAVEVPDVLVIGKSETTKDGARVTIVHVAGEDLLVKEGTAGGGEWAGTLAAAGQIVDTVHDGTCRAEACVLIVPSTATTTDGYGTNSASFALVSIKAGEDGIKLLPNSASTTDFSFFGDRCIDFSTALLATGSGQLAAASLAALVGPKVEVGSAGSPC